MPWSVGDVDKHKKGLSDTQKKRWVRIANLALKSCMDKGGSDATCAASAIRHANGVVGNADPVYSSYKRKQPNYTVEIREHQGRTHLVVPVTMMVEGVHNGSHGSIFHSINELGKFPEVWNGIPVVIDHPEIEGQNVSANTPEIIDARTVGRVYHTAVNGSSLRAEAWIDEEKLRQVFPVLLTQIQSGELIEVSLGMFSDQEEMSGEWHGESYEAIAKNHRPDHLALLPGGVGACSVGDGCGIRAFNKKGGVGVTSDDLIQVMKNLNKEGYRVNLIGTNAEQGYKTLVDSVRQKLDSMDSSASIHFLQEVYEDFIIYEVRQMIGGSRLYKQGYQIASDGTVELQGTPEEVHKKVEYVTLAEGSSIQRTKFNNLKKENIIMANESAPDIKKKVDNIIANSNGKYTECDREKLQTLSEDLLDKIAKPVIVEKEVEKVVEKEVQVNVLSDEDRALLEFGKTQMKETRDALVKTIMDNTEKGIWTEAVLNAKDLDDLKRISKSVKKVTVADYSLNGGGSTIQDNEEAPVMLPAGFEVQTDKK